MSDLKDDITTLVKARYTCIYVSTTEEQRAQAIIADVCKLLGWSNYQWTGTTGLISGSAREDLENPIEALDKWRDLSGKNGSILVLPDFHAFMENKNVVRKLKEVSFDLRNSMKTIVIISSVQCVPDELQKEITLIDLDYPNIDEIKAQVKKDLTACPNTKILLTGTTLEQLTDDISRASVGLTLQEVDDIISKAAVIGKIEIKDIIQQKKQIIKKSGLLEYYDVSEFSISDIGGNELLKEDIRRDKKRFSKKAQEYGLEQPKSRLCIGSPGTGKSLSVKAIAAELDLPLVCLSAGSIASEYYGKTTQNMRKALKLALAINPCVLWIDEIEKMLSTGEGSGHEETVRALSEILTFMEESQGVYFVGTCNDYRPLKPELLQRFEKIYFVDLPNRTGREEIFAIHLKKFKRDPAKFDLKALSQHSDGFSGREIRIALKEAMVRAFDEDKEVTTDHIVEMLIRTTPTSRSRRSEIEDMRGWAEKNCLPSSKPEMEVVQPGETVLEPQDRFKYINNQ